jgi:hypothetical protein
MKRIVAILGTLVIAAIIIISGSAVATWVYADHYEPAYSYDYTNPTYAEDSPDNLYATVGKNGPPRVLGRLTLDMTEGNAIPPDTNFVVFGHISGITETYTVTVWDGSHETSDYLGSGSDTTNETFTTAYDNNIMWRYIQIDGTSGQTGTGDTIYGPEIDAVGWDKP